jgi:antitoxin (DNA-binding transcriptional repressor) of toxin-antitoxin stability system
MEIVNIHQAKCHLSRLLQGVAEGRPFFIAKAGKPIARVTAIDAPEPAQIKRLGFLAGQFSVPDDFDRMGQEEILAQFGLDE